MKVIKDNEELKSYIKNGSIDLNCSIKCDFNINVEANINAWDIKACDINAWNINARDIDAGDINARDINARDINARDIKAWDIDARDISFWSFCIVKTSLTCQSIKGRRYNNVYKCLDTEIEYVNDDKIITIDGKDIKIYNESFNELKKQINKL